MVFFILVIMKKQPIGVFDSGVGGTSILREIVKKLPNEDYIYLADSKNAPYGEKSVDEIVALCEKNVLYLLSQNCKLIVVACNTATTNAISVLRAKYNVPFIGIEPAIKPAAISTQTKRIGILATKGTINSKLFSEKVDFYSEDIEVFEVVGTGLVEAIEQGDLNSFKLKNLLKAFLDPLLKRKIDFLVLGCTHYPYLLPVIHSLVGDSVRVIDSGEAVARQTAFVLKEQNLLFDKQDPSAQVQIFSNKDTKVVEQIIAPFFKNYLLKKVVF